MEFVDRAEISPIYYDKPYYLVPLKNGQRAYALLRDVMKKSEKVGVAKIVIRTRQHLGALLVEDDLLVLNLMRFPQELREAAKFGTALNREHRQNHFRPRSRAQDGRATRRIDGGEVAAEKISRRISRRLA